MEIKCGMFMSKALGYIKKKQIKGVSTFGE